MKFFTDFLANDEGTTAVEYGVMLALILLGMIVSVGAFGGSTGSWWGGIVTEFTSYF